MYPFCAVQLHVNRHLSLVINVWQKSLKKFFLLWSLQTCSAVHKDCVLALGTYKGAMHMVGCFATQKWAHKFPGCACLVGKCSPFYINYIEIVCNMTTDSTWPEHPLRAVWCLNLLHCASCYSEKWVIWLYLISYF